MTLQRMPLAALVLASVLVLWALPVEARTPAVPPPATGERGARDAACDPEVRDALAESAQAGVEAELAVIRHPDQGIRNPDSIFDFSCIWDLFDYSSFDILFDPAGALEDILDHARRRLCAAARDAYRRYLGRALDPGVYTAPLPRLPGLDIDRTRRSVPGAQRPDDASRFRDVIEGAR